MVSRNYNIEECKNRIPLASLLPDFDEAIEVGEVNLPAYLVIRAREVLEILRQSQTRTPAEVFGDMDTVLNKSKELEEKSRNLLIKYSLAS